LRVAGDRASALAALDDAAKALMTLHRLLVTASPAGDSGPQPRSGSAEVKVQGR
jgi:hypothetical protein